MSNLNEESIKDAIRNGINGDAVGATLEDVINKSDELGKNPRQVKNVVETIVHMKKNVNSIPDKKYASNIVKENSEKIKRALSEGIRPNEIATTLIESVQKANSRRTKSRLRFITKLIVKMKEKELKLLKNKEKDNTINTGTQKARQKIYEYK